MVILSDIMTALVQSAPLKFIKVERFESLLDNLIIQNEEDLSIMAKNSLCYLIVTTILGNEALWNDLFSLCVG